MSAASLFGLPALRARIASMFARAERPVAAQKGGRAEAIPVRDWISTGTGQPARLLGFDQAAGLGRRSRCSRSAW